MSQQWLKVGELWKPWTALGLLTLVATVFVAEHVWALAPETGPLNPSPITLYGFGNLTSSAVLGHGQMLRLFSSMLLHASLVHLLGNGVGLLLAGWFLERLVGRPWFLAIFIVSSLGGAVAVLAVSAGVSVGVTGASAGVMGLLGAMFVLSFRLSPGRRRTVMNLLAALLIILTLIPAGHGLAGRVVYFAHLGGLLVGTAIALMLLLTWGKASRFPRFEHVGRLVGVAGIAMALLGIPVSLSLTRTIISASLQCLGKDRDAVIQGCSAALASGEGNQPDMLLRRGSAHLGKGNYDLAIADFDRLIVLAPKMDVAYLNRGFAYNSKNVPQLAIEDFNKAIQLNPGEAALAYLDRGETYFHERRFDRTIADETEAIRLEPNLAFAYATRAEAYGATDAPDQAIADFSRALKLNSADPRFYYKRGAIYTSVGRLDEAIADYTEVIRRDPTFSASYNNRAWALHLKGEGALGLADAEKAVALLSHDKDVLETRAEIYEQLGRKADSIADYETVLAINPGERLAHEGLSRLQAEISP